MYTNKAFQPYFTQVFFKRFARANLVKILQVLIVIPVVYVATKGANLAWSSVFVITFTAVVMALYEIYCIRRDINSAKKAQHIAKIGSITNVIKDKMRNQFDIDNDAQNLVDAIAAFMQDFKGNTVESVRNSVELELSMINPICVIKFELYTPKLVSTDTLFEMLLILSIQNYTEHCIRKNASIFSLKI